ncbi:MAG TPA: diguanylate cyclase [Thermoanaerobaculia bacterium]|nr:diguanylate cyclase [Thermoanaerobaculia bacterium]
MIADDRPVRAALALTLTLGALALLFAQAFQTSRSVTRRIGYDPTNLPDGTHVEDVTPGGPADRAGLRKGDRIVMIGGVPISGLLSYGTATGRFQAGKPVPLRVVRGGRVIALTMHPGMPFPLLTFLFNAVTALGFLAVALLALTQSLRDLRTRLLLGFSMAVAIELLLPGALVAVIGRSGLKTLATCSFYLLTGIEFSFELHLASLIPERPAWLRRRPWVVPLYYVVGLGFGLTWCAVYLGDERGAHALPWTSGQADNWLNQFALPFWALAVSTLLASQALGHPEPRGRHQAGLVLSATAAWFLFTLYTSILSLTGNPAPDWVSPLQTLVLLCFPVAMFAAIFRYNLFDIELAVRRGLIYTALSGALVLVFYGVLGACWLLFPAAGEPGAGPAGRQSLWGVGIAMLLLGLLFAPLRRFTHRLIDRGFFPERNVLRQRLIALAGELPALGKLPRMGRHLVARLTEIFESRSAVLLIASPESGLLKVLAATGGGWEDAERSLLLALDDPGIEMLRRASRPVAAPQLAARSTVLAHRLRDLDATGLAVPLLIQERLIGGLLVGAKPDGQPYPSEEQDLLVLLAHHVASVFENARLFESATYESLTGLLRREAILDQLNHELERAQRYGRPLTLAMADLDHFKEVNDRYGHLAGDTLLKAVSQVASEGLRSTDMIGRYGGEEFLVVLPETDIAGAVSVAEKIRSLVQKTSVPMEDGTMVRVTISIGLASLRDGQPRQERATARDLIGAADRSLYQAKNKGRNRVFPMVA